MDDISEMHPLDALANMIKTGAFSTVQPNEAVGLTRTALADQKYLDSRAGAPVDKNSVFASIMSEYIAKRSIQLASDSAVRYVASERQASTAHTAGMFSHLGMSDDEIGRAMYAQSVGDGSSMARVREQFYFG